MKKGFTLVELAIVLVVIGLLIGGILVGQSLISSARVKNVIREYAQYESAIRLFYAQFKGLPGDSSKAGASLGMGAGDDDGGVEHNNESFWAWRHLSVASYIPKNASTSDGIYSGTHSGVVSKGLNTPYSKVFPKAVWFLQGLPQYIQSTGGAVGWNGQYTGDQNKGRNMLRLGDRQAGKSGSTDGHNYVGPLTVEELYSIDSKVDDSFPATGDVVHHAPWSSMFDCSTTNVYSTSVYNLSQAGAVCHVCFWLPKF